MVPLSYTSTYTHSLSLSPRSHQRAHQSSSPTLQDQHQLTNRPPTPLPPPEPVLGPSTTQLFRNAAAALRLEAGDELVLSAVDHEANVAPWTDLAERQGLVVRWWRPSSATTTTTTSEYGPRLVPGDLAPLLGERTRLVAFTHASNILGTIHDVKGICEVVRARAPGALVCVDAV